MATPRPRPLAHRSKIAHDTASSLSNIIQMYQHIKKCLKEAPLLSFGNRQHPPARGDPFLSVSVPLGQIGHDPHLEKLPQGFPLRPRGHR